MINAAKDFSKENTLQIYAPSKSYTLSFLDKLDKKYIKYELVNNNENLVNMPLFDVSGGMKWNISTKSICNLDRNYLKSLDLTDSIKSLIKCL